MKKIGLIIAFVSLTVLLLSSGVWADLVLTTGGSGPGLTYETSPNVHMDYGNSTATDGFFITSVNEKGTMEYGIVSDYSGYYQHTVDVGQTSAEPAVNATISGWTPAGG